MQLGAERGPEGSEAWGSIDVGSARRISAGLRRLHPLSLGDFPDVMLASLAPGWGNARTKLGSRNSERPDWHRVITVKSRSIPFATEFLMGSYDRNGLDEQSPFMC